MKLGIAAAFPHKSPEEWALLHKNEGLGAVVFPCAADAPQKTIDAYKKAADDAGLRIAEVGCWSNPMSPDPVKRKDALAYCIRQTELAEYVGAACCVNISGAVGDVWDGSYPENYAEETYERIVLSVQTILDAVRPKRTAYTLEPMPHMLPDSPESYLQLIRDIDRPGFGAHIDLVNMITSPRIFYENRELADRSFTLLGPYIRSCHLKDAKLAHSLTVSISETVCGDGGVDLAYYMRRADECAPDLPMILEHLPTTESYHSSAAYILSLYQGKQNP